MLTEFGLKIAPSTYYAALTRPPSARAVRDEELMEMIDRIYRENYSVYGALNQRVSTEPGAVQSRGVGRDPFLNRHQALNAGLQEAEGR